MYNIKSLIKSISMDEMCSLFEKSKPAKVYKKDSHLFHQGEKADCFYFLKSGAVKVFSISPDGHERTVFVHRKKGIFAASSFFSDEIRRSSAVTLSKSEIISIDKKMVDTYITQNPKFALCIIQDMSIDINLMFDQITSTSFLNSKEKVASFIVNCIDNNKYSIRDDMVCLNIGQDDMSKSLGLSRPTINKTLSYFQRNGWIKTQYKYILILDYNSLKAYCTENL